MDFNGSNQSKPSSTTQYYCYYYNSTRRPAVAGGCVPFYNSWYPLHRRRGLTSHQHPLPSPSFRPHSLRPNRESHQTPKRARALVYSRFEVLQLHRPQSECWGSNHAHAHDAFALMLMLRRGVAERQQLVACLL